MSEDKQPTLVEYSTAKREGSFYSQYGVLCALCRGEMDHPPIKIALEAPTLKAPMGKDTPPYAEYTATCVCRDCLLEALAPLEKEHEGNPRAGWLFRSILRGDLEPRGIKEIPKSGVGKEVAEDTPVGHGDTESD